VREGGRVVKVTVRPAPTSLEGFDDALAEARPLPGMSLPVLQQKWAKTAELLYDRARFWDAQVKEAEEGPVMVLGTLLEAARLCAAHDRDRAAWWESHAKEVAKQR
jgi:hypothetical protein